MDHLSVSDKNYDKKYNDMQERLDKLYDEITDIENAMEEVETRLYNSRRVVFSNLHRFEKKEIVREQSALCYLF